DDRPSRGMTDQATVIPRLDRGMTDQATVIPRLDRGIQRQPPNHLLAEGAQFPPRNPWGEPSLVL
ncbi:MAG: hypothetical protein HYW48_09205, partial [Deltaproteobacteria bacterium]|nr:hypothetical protein [Deltaproteobacteria bacterium]